MSLFFLAFLDENLRGLLVRNCCGRFDINENGSLIRASFISIVLGG
jgi:hypothetical protein